MIPRPEMKTVDRVNFADSNYLSVFRRELERSEKEEEWERKKVENQELGYSRKR